MLMSSPVLFCKLFAFCKSRHINNAIELYLICHLVYALMSAMIRPFLGRVYH